MKFSSEIEVNRGTLTVSSERREGCTYGDGETEFVITFWDSDAGDHVEILRETDPGKFHTLMKAMKTAVNVVEES